MSSIKVRVLMTVIVCTLLTAFICGGLASQTSSTGSNINVTVGEAANNIFSIAQKTQNVSRLVEGNAELMETNSENVVKLKNIVDMFHN